jgi:hypothetical protein
VIDYEEVFTPRGKNGDGTNVAHCGGARRLACASHGCQVYVP